MMAFHSLEHLELTRMPSFFRMLHIQRRLNNVSSSCWSRYCFQVLQRKTDETFSLSSSPDVDLQVLNWQLSFSNLFNADFAKLYPHLAGKFCNAIYDAASFILADCEEWLRGVLLVGPSNVASPSLRTARSRERQNKASQPKMID